MPALHHLAFRTADVAALSAFYAEWFGLRAVFESERAVWLALEDAVLMIERAEPDEPAITPGSREFFALRVDEGTRVSLRARLCARGMLEAETAATLYFRDPDGRRVGVSTFVFA